MIEPIENAAVVTELVYCSICNCMPTVRPWVPDQDEYVCEYH
jgi:hypothetical protein